MDWKDAAAQWLERFFGDPMADAVPVTAHVVAASEPVGRTRYQTCRLELLLEATGVPSTMAHTEAVIDRAHWPRVGMTLPATLSRTHPDVLDVDWEALAR